MMTRDEISKMMEKYTSYLRLPDTKNSWTEYPTSSYPSEEERFMNKCREITKDERKCEFCELRFKCFTEDWDKKEDGDVFTPDNLQILKRDLIKKYYTTNGKN